MLRVRSAEEQALRGTYEKLPTERALIRIGQIFFAILSLAGEPTEKEEAKRKDHDCS